jgi:hypothetical protein
MQYILTQSEYDKMEPGKATRILVEFILATRPMFTLPDPDFCDDRIRQYTSRKCAAEVLSIAERYGADADEVNKAWEEAVTKLPNAN